MKSFPPLKPNIVLGIAAHPDDLDFGAGGSLARFAAEGAKVYYLILTDGSKGSPDKHMTSEELVKIREAEQRAACQVIGGQAVRFLHHPDGGLEVKLDIKAEVVRVIRELKPDTVITMDPSLLYVMDDGFINHPDHRAAGQMALDAVFPLARDHLSFPELYQTGLEPHKVKTVLLINFEKQNFCVDISDHLETKFAALAAHTSQIPDMPAVKKQFTAMAAGQGKQAGCRYAEGFVRLDVMP